MRLTFLGTGTSFGIPVVGCDCSTCTSNDPRDRRTRNAALLELPGGTLLVDAPPELRLQLLREGTRSLDAVWFTHTHADHVHGIDDLRIFSARRGDPLPAYIPEPYVAEMRARFPYIFDPSVCPPEGTTKPELRVHAFDGEDSLEILGETFHPLRVPHGPATCFGFRVGALGYVTDGKSLPPEAMRRLEGVRVLVLNALWWGNPHPTHFNVEEALEAARSVGAARTFLIHLTHRLRHGDLASRLPPGVEPAHDGLSLEV